MDERTTPTGRPAGRARAWLLALAAASAALCTTAQAEVVMVFNSGYSDSTHALAPGPTWRTRPNYDPTARQVLGRLDIGTPGFTSTITPTGSLDTLPPCHPNCSWARGDSYVGTVVNANDGSVHGYAHSLGGQGMTTAASSTFGTRDVIHVVGGHLKLSLHIDAFWSDDAMDEPSGGDTWIHQARLGGLVFLAPMGCSTSQAPNPLLCGPHTHELRFQGGVSHAGAPVLNDDSGWVWNHEAKALGDRVDDSRWIELFNLPDGDYELNTEFFIATQCVDTCEVTMNFANTGHVGVEGNYTSASGYAYLGRTDSEPPPPGTVPTPESLALVLAGLGLTGAFGTRRRGV